MKTSMKIWLIIIALALLAWLVVLKLRPDESDESIATSVPDTSRPSFEVRVVVPRGGLPLFGILPDRLVTRYDLTPRELGFDQASRGSKIGSIEPDHLQLSAEGGWDLSIETDGEGRVAPGTRLVFPLGLGGKQVKLSCRPANPGIGHLHTTTRSGSDVLDGRFLVELATCENADSGKTINWPPAPLTVRGIFDGLPHGHR